MKKFRDIVDEWLEQAKLLPTYVGGNLIITSLRRRRVVPINLWVTRKAVTLYQALFIIARDGYIPREEFIDIIISATGEREEDIRDYLSLLDQMEWIRIDPETTHIYPRFKIWEITVVAKPTPGKTTKYPQYRFWEFRFNIPLPLTYEETQLRELLYAEYYRPDLPNIVTVIRHIIEHALYEVYENKTTFEELEEIDITGIREGDIHDVETLEQPTRITIGLGEVREIIPSEYYGIHFIGSHDELFRRYWRARLGLIYTLYERNFLFRRDVPYEFKWPSHLQFIIDYKSYSYRPTPELYDLGVPTGYEIMISKEGAIEWFGGPYEESITYYIPI